MKMNSNYNINIYGNLSIKNKLYSIAKVLSIISSVGFILFAFIGEIGRIANEFYISNGIGVVQLISLSSVWAGLVYLMKISLEFMNTKSIKFSIIEFISYIFVCIGIFNYWIYYELTNDKKIGYLLIGYIVIYIIKYLISIFAQYRFWKEIYVEGITLYGDSFEEYHEVVIKYSKPLIDREQLDVCINLFNSDDVGFIVDLIRLQNKYKKWKANKQ